MSFTPLGHVLVPRRGVRLLGHQESRSLRHSIINHILCASAPLPFGGFFAQFRVNLPCSLGELGVAS